MLNSILSVRSLLLAIFVLMAGNGFMATLVSLRLEAAGRNALLIGLVATAYFAGLTIGSLRVSSLVRRIGHIRAYAASVALLSASTLAYSLFESVPFWSLLRFVDGLCIAGVYVCLESWLNDRAEAATRGTVLAAYMIALYGGQSIGQMLLNVQGAGPGTPFILASLLISLAILPVALTRAQSPAFGSDAPLSMRRLYAISPLGVVGAAATGVMLGAFYGLGAVHLRRLGLGLSEVAFVMSMVILGGVALQWPLGWLSDRLERRRVIVGAFGGTAGVAFLLFLTSSGGIQLVVLGCLFGGLSFALYPLCVAHTNDHVSAEQRVGASGGLVLLYSAGAAAGPLGAAAVLPEFEPSGLFLFIAGCAATAFLFALWRQWARLPVPLDLQQPYLTLPRTTPMSATLDPIAPDPDQ